MIETIIQTSVILAALSTICGVVYKCRKGIKERFLEDVHKKIDETNKKVDVLQLQVIRLNILNLIHNDPQNKQAIMLTYDEYKRMGGNSYIDYIYYEWKKEFMDKKDEPVKYEILNKGK